MKDKNNWQKLPHIDNGRIYAVVDFGSGWTVERISPEERDCRCFTFDNYWFAYAYAKKLTKEGY